MRLVLIIAVFVLTGIYAALATTLQDGRSLPDVVITDPDTGLPITSFGAPVTGTPTDASGTIASTGVYQTVFAASSTRKGCTIQNKSTNAMSVRVGGGTIWSLPAGQAFYCNWQGVTVTSLIELTGTAGDAFAAARQ